MALTSITRGTNLPNTASKADVHGLVDNAVISVKDIANADIKSDAAIADTKLATIATAGKVNSSALTTTSKAAGDFLYSTGTGWARLPVGTAGQKLRVAHDTISGTCMTVAYDSGELAAAATSITISGLDGDVDEEYELIVRAANGHADACAYSVRLNADDGADHYGYQALTAINTVAGASRNAADSALYPSIHGVVTTGSIQMFSGKIFAKSGQPRTAIFKSANDISTTTVTEVNLNGCSWGNTADNVTSLSVVASASDGLGIGSRVILLKRSATPTTKTWEEIYTKTIGNGNLLINGNFEGWVGGTSAAPDGWTIQGADAVVAREDTAGFFKIGTYSAVVVRHGTDCYLRFDIANPTKYQGKTLTFGCWVRAGVANRARLLLSSSGGAGAGVLSSYHTGGGTFEWLTTTITVAADDTYVGIRCQVDNGDTSVYFDGAVCVEAATLASTTSTDNFEATSLTIPSLTGNTDVLYRLRARVVNGYNGSSAALITFNTDTGANYGYQYIRGINTDVTAGRGPDSSMFFNVSGSAALANLTQGEMLIYAKSGYVRTIIVEGTNGISGTTVAELDLIGNSWNNTADEITSMVITASEDNGLGIGTTISLERLNL